jgi:hypothetical protein
MSIAGYQVARRSAKNEIHERLRVAALDRHKMVMDYVAQQHDRIGLVASRTQLRKHIQDHVYNGRDVADIRQPTVIILEDARQSTVGCVDIWIVGPDGKVVTSTAEVDWDGDFADRAEFEHGLDGAYLGEPVFENGTPRAYLSAPAKTNDGRLLGVVIMLLDVTPLVELLTDTYGLGETGEVLVATRAGDDVHYLIPPRDRSKMVNASRVPAMAAAIAGKSHFETTEYEGVDVLALYRPIDYQPRTTQPWGLVAKIDAAEAYAPALPVPSAG